MQKSLQQASENPRLGLEELAKLLKEAAENLKNEDQQGAQQSLDEAAQELDSLEEKLQSQELRTLRPSSFRICSNRCASANRQAHNKAEEASRDKPRARRDKGREDSAASNKMIKPKACSSGQEPKANPPIKRVWTARPARQCLATAKAMA